MRLLLLTRLCPDTAGCPKIYMRGHDTLLVQGDRFPVLVQDPQDPSLSVEIPIYIAQDALTEIRRFDLPSISIASSFARGTCGIRQSPQEGFLVVSGIALPTAELTELDPPDHETVVEIPIAGLVEWHRNGGW